MPYEDTPPPQVQQKQQDLQYWVEKRKQEMAAARKRGALFVPSGDIPPYDPNDLYRPLTKIKQQAVQLPPKVEAAVTEEQLPPGAIGRDEYGRPYYGGTSYITEWWKGANARWNLPIDKEETPKIGQTMQQRYDEVMRSPYSDQPLPSWEQIKERASKVNWGEELKEAGLGLLEQISLAGQYIGSLFQNFGDQGSKPNTLTYIGRGIKEAAAGGFATLQQADIEYEKWLGTVNSILKAGEAPELDSPIPPGEYLFDRNEIIERVPLAKFTPFTWTYNATRFFTSSQSWEEKKKFIGDNYEASRIFYTSAIDPVAKEEFIREFQEPGANPYLLAQEYENPLAEAAGQMINDSWMFYGMGASKIKDFLRIRSAKKTWYEVPGLIDNVIKVSGQLDDAAVANRMQDLTEVYMAERALAASKMDDLSRSASVVQLTADGKRFMEAREVGELVTYLASNTKGDPDEILEILVAMVKGGNDDLNEVATALQTLLRFEPTPRPFFSKAGMRASHVLRNMLLNEEGIVDTAGFLAGMRRARAKGVDNLIKYVDRKYLTAIDEMFPTILERVAKGEKVSPTLRAIARFHDLMYTKGPYKYINRFFASVYLGMNPGYAFRNLWTNSFQMLIDEGPGVFMKKPNTAYEDIVAWNGGQAPRGMEGFGGIVAGEKGARPRGTVTGAMINVADVFETNAAKQVMDKAFVRTMHQLLNIDNDLALPNVLRIIEAGMPEELARPLKAMVLQHKGDVAKAAEEFIQQYMTGIFEKYRGFGWMSMDDIQILDDYNVSEAFLRAMGEDSVDDAVNAWETVINDLIRKADSVVDDVSSIADNAPAAEYIMNMSEARRQGFLTDEMIEVATDGAQANHESNLAWEKAIRQSNDLAHRTLTSQGADAAQTTEALRALMRRVQVRFGDETYTGMDLVDGTIGLNAKRVAKRLTDETWAISRSIDLADTREELVRLWRSYGLPGDVPAIIVKKEMKDLLWETYWRRQKNFWQGFRDMYAEHAQRVIGDIAGFSGIDPDLRVADWMLERARKYDPFLLESEVWFNLSRALKRGDNAGAIRLYAHQFGIPSLSATGAPLDDNLLLNIVNSQMGRRYTELADVPPAVGRQAMLQHAVGDMISTIIRDVSEEMNLRPFLDSISEEIRAGGFGALSARERNDLLWIMNAATPGEQTILRDAMEAIEDIRSMPPEALTGLEPAEMSRLQTAWDEAIDAFLDSIENIARRLDVENEPLKLRLGITNIKGLEQPIDELMTKAAELEAAGNLEGADEIYRTAVQYGIDYIKDVFGDMVEDAQFSIGRYFGENEPTMYITTRELTADELPDFLYTLQRIADYKFNQNDLLVFGQYMDDVTSLGVVRRADGLVSRIEPALDINFSRSLSAEDLKTLDELMNEFGIAGGTLKPGNSGMEITNIQWYNIRYADDLSEVKNARQAAEELERFLERLDELGFLADGRRGARETWAFGHSGETDITRADAASQGITGTDWQRRYNESIGVYTYDDFNSYFDALRGGEASAEIEGRIARAAYQPATWTGDLAREVAGRLPTERPRLTPDMKPWSGGIPSEARVLYDQRIGLSLFRDRISQGIRQNWGDIIEVTPNRQVFGAVRSWAKEAASRVATSRLAAGEVARAARDFILHAYPKKRNFDLAASYVYPFHFWYNRTYFNWMKRIVLEPEVLTAYAIYKDYLSKVHAGMPEWWRYNINSNDLLGINAKNPLFFNLEATLNPIYGLTGVDFEDSRKRVNWWTSVLDDLGKFGPSVWTPWQIATAVALYNEGEKDAAARWGGRLFPQTAVIKSASALLGVPGGWEIDPMILLLSDGLDVYERRRIGRSAGQMIEEGLISKAEAEEGMYTQQGDTWEQAIQRAALGRAPGTITSFMFGAGFRIRPVTDQQIDVMDDYLHNFYSMEANLSPDEVADTFAWFRQEFPFFDTVILARKTVEERDRVYAYSVLGRIPPGQKNDMFEALSVDPKLVDKFYEEKGHIWDWTQADQDKFMSAIVELGALVESPDNAVAAEWREASKLRSQLEKDIVARYGDDVDEMMDVYFVKRRKSTDLGNEYLDSHPVLGEVLDYRTAQIQNTYLLNKYYGSIENTRSYLRSKMFDKIEMDLGAEIWDTWDQYFEEQLLGDDAARDFWKAHPELKEYGEYKDAWEKVIADQLAKIERWLPPRQYPSMREDMPETLSVGQENVMSYLQETGMPEQFGYNWSDWQELFSPHLQRLVMDHFMGGEELSDNVVSALDRVAGDVGIDTDLLINLVGESIQNQYGNVHPMTIQQARKQFSQEGKLQEAYNYEEDDSLTDYAKDLIKRNAMEQTAAGTQYYKGEEGENILGFQFAYPEAVARREEQGFRRFGYTVKTPNAQFTYRHELAHIIDAVSPGEKERISDETDFRQDLIDWAASFETKLDYESKRILLDNAVEWYAEIFTMLAEDPNLEMFKGKQIKRWFKPFIKGIEKDW